MSINHHLDDATILSYAAGSLPQAFEILVACHLRQCSHCRERVAEAEMLGGMLLDALAPVPLKDSASQPELLLSAMPDVELADIDWQLPPVQAVKQTVTVEQPVLDAVARDALQQRQAEMPSEPWRREVALPQPLEQLYNEGEINLPWKRLVPGVQHIPLPSAEGCLRLLKIAPGISIPLHSHEGSELTLILQGSYSDEIGRFKPGDIADLDCDTEHQPITDGKEACVCLVATDAPLRFNGLLPRMLQPFTGF